MSGIIKKIELIGIFLDFIGAMLLATAILKYSDKNFKYESDKRKKEIDELNYIDEHLKRTKKIAKYAIVFLIIGFLLTISSVYIKKN